MTVSVCMATYNGHKYIAKQIDSILPQLESTDELLVSDDGSTDDTVDLVKSYHDSRVHLISGPRQGCVMNFEHAIKAAGGDIIFLSDQDDIWRHDKIDSVRRIFAEHPEVKLVCHNYSIIDAEDKVVAKAVKKNIKFGYIYNLVKQNMFTGNCMAFRRDCLPFILPVPDNKYIYHDNWIGLRILAKYKSAVRFVDEDFSLYRRHGENVSAFKSTLPVIGRIYRRVLLVWYSFLSDIKPLI